MADAQIISRHSTQWAQFNNSIAARLETLGTWNVLRLGLLCGIRQDAPVSAISPVFAFGFCAGTANVFGDASVTHFVGVQMETAAWSINGDYLDSDVNTPTKKVGVTQTDGTSMSATVFIHARQDTVNVRSVLMLELTKGSPNYSFRIFRRSAAGIDITPVVFRAAMEAASPTATSHSFQGPQTLAVDEGVDGTLNAVNVYWNLTTSSLEVEEIMVVKMS